MWIFKEHNTRSLDHKTKGLIPGEDVYVVFMESAEHVLWIGAMEIAKEEVVNFIRKKGSVGDIYLKADYEIAHIPGGGSTKTVARFVIRKDGLPMTGKIFDGKVLKPNRIYQTEEVLEELIIKDVGPSTIQDKQFYPGAPNWGYDFNWIFENYKEFIMTKIELLKHFPTSEKGVRHAKLFFKSIKRRDNSKRGAAHPWMWQSTRSKRIFCGG
jgi:hypothetical protein